MSGSAPAIAAHGLRTRHSLPAEPLTDHEFSELVLACERERILGFFGFAVGSGAFPTTCEQHELLEANLAAWASHALRVERMLLDALGTLSGAGIQSRVLKGVALAHTAYPQPELRVFGDVDLLIPSGEMLRAVDVLAEALGGERAQPELRPGFDQRFGKEVMLRCGELELDLHRVFVEGGLGLTIDLDDLFAPPYRFPLAGYELEALPMPQRFLHACYAAALGDWPPRLVSQRDVAELVLREKPHLVDVLLMAKAWRCEVVVARAVTLTWRTLAIEDRPPLVTWAEQYVPSRFERALIDAHEGPARAFTRHLAAIVVLPGLRDRLAYAEAIVFPQRSYLAARDLSATSHLDRAWKRLRG